MMQASSFSNWNTTPNTIANTGNSGAVWRIYEGHTTPLLTSFMASLTLSDASVTYNGTETTGTTTVLSGVSGIAAKGTDAGTYRNSYYSTQQGYDISGGNLTINAAALSMNGTRAYDGSVDVSASIFTLSGLVGGQSLTLTGSGTVADKNAGINKTVTLGSLSLGNGTGGLASNYTFTGGTQTATIRGAPLNFSATPPASVLNATTQLASIAASPQTIVQPTVLSLSPAITVTQTNSAETAGSNTGPTSKPDNLATVNTTMTIGSTGPALQIVNGGVRLPGTLVSANE